MKTINDLKVEKTFYRRERDILGNVERIPYQKEVKRHINLVTPGVRFGYYLLDLVFYYIISFLITFITIIVVLSINQENYEFLYLIDQYSTIISMFIFFLYYALTEYLMGGTFSKLIFGYVVIDEYANKMSFGKSLLRTISRFVPFEAFSCFGERGWHDVWSKTYVVKRKERDELKKLLRTIHDDKDILD